MIVGNGDIASVLPERDDVIFFASGVSNSREEREEEYMRERKLLMAQDHSKHLVYFSSLATLFAESRYLKHKLMMEHVVKSFFSPYTIVRIGNITWGDNPHTIINFMRNQVKAGKKLEIRDETKYVVDQEEFLHWINLIPSRSCEMNIPGRRMTVKQIVKQYVNN